MCCTEQWHTGVNKLIRSSAHGSARRQATSQNRAARRVEQPGSTAGFPDVDDRFGDGLVGLGPLAEVRHGRLSAGQRRRLAIAVGLARAPKLLLLDEPHAGLDGDGREALDDMLRSSRTDGRTVLLASHELGRVRTLADREVTLASGRCGTATPVAGVPTR